MFARCSLTILIFTSACLPLAQAQVIRYVDDDAATGGDGLAWATAYKCLQDALWEAGANGTITDIRVAQGTYTPDVDEGGQVTPGDRAANFGLISGVKLKGGYAGLGARDPDARDIKAQETILSGDLAGDDGPDFANDGENSYHVVTGGVLDATAVLDGVTITGGNGGPGGGVSLSGVSASLSSDPTLVDCTIRANRGGTGGGMYFYRSAASLTGCTLSGNLSGTSGGGFAAASGYYFLGPTFLRCTVSGNSAGSEGGGGHASGEILLKMQECTLSENTAVSDGGALHLSQDTNAYVTDCVLRKNSAGGDGGAVYSNAGVGGYAGFTNCVFGGNKASGDGGAYRDPGFSSYQGFARCTFNGNTAVHGGAISVYGDDSHVGVNNCIVWDNGGGELSFGPYTSVTMNYSDVDHYLSGTGTGNIRVYPRFVDADGPDGIYGTEDDNLRLQPASPCINTGDPAFLPGPEKTDLDGHSRVLCGRLDMGAYEFGIGDYDCDLGVDLDDFYYWDRCVTGPGGGPYDPGCEAFDFEYDADVDLKDVAGFQMVFGID
ncbi:MAG TPA: right-handed parallel beta-helix repeat-containing protein [Phycisphaerae bacterium]|nr:right-handed parallel beta-helix repeat-containing protein [Phycisphaerae bacterium]